jgi:hypothetical protein
VTTAAAISDAQTIWDAWSPVAAVIGGFATGIAAAFAGGALWYARNQIQSNSAVAREQDAQSVYSEYLKLCIEYPELSSATLAVKTLPSKTFAGLAKQLTTESERYLWFVSYMLSACEKIILTCPDDIEWDSTVRAQISYHKSSLGEAWSEIRTHYHKSLRDIVEDELSDGSENSDA